MANNYVKFSTMPVKGRIKWTSEQLIKLGYLVNDQTDHTKRTKSYVKALTKFQRDNGLGPNGEVHEKEFLLLNSIK